MKRKLLLTITAMVAFLIGMLTARVALAQAEREPQKYPAHACIEFQVERELVRRINPLQISAELEQKNNDCLYWNKVTFISPIALRALDTRTISAFQNYLRVDNINIGKDFSMTYFSKASTSAKLQFVLTDYVCEASYPVARENRKSYDTLVAELASLKKQYTDFFAQEDFFAGRPIGKKNLTEAKERIASCVNEVTQNYFSNINGNWHDFSCIDYDTATLLTESNLHKKRAQEDKIKNDLQKLLRNDNITHLLVARESLAEYRTDIQRSSSLATVEDVCNQARSATRKM